jgi:starch-binding outer membrane protein, SusD/RagB family
MNRLKLLKFTVVGALLISFAGCNEILEDVQPSTSVSGEVVLTSAEGVNALRASMYDRLHSQFAYQTEYFIAPSAFTDETRNRPGSTRYQGLTTAVGTSGTAHIATWGAHYEVLQDANLLIGAIPEGVLDAATLNRYRGEALAIRAFAMHNLVKVWGYEPGNFDQGELESNWDAGVIIRTEPTIDLTDADLRPRASVTDVYAQILQDLSDAKGLLAGINANNTFATEAFVDALSARVNLYAGNWGAAATAAQAAITNSGRTLADTDDDVADMFDALVGGHPEAIFKVVVNSSTENGGWNNNGPGTYSSTGFLAQLPTQFLVDKYEAGDYRLGWYRDCADAQRIALNQPTGCADVNTGGFSLVKFNGSKGNHVDDLPFIRLAEMYLIWAEAAAKAANDPNAAAGPLNTLRTARNVGAVPAFASITEMEDFVLDERMRELALEGHRFFDLKRLQRDIRNPDGTIKMFADSYRILPQIGSGLINVNPLLVENPGY